MDFEPNNLMDPRQKMVRKPLPFYGCDQVIFGELAAAAVLFGALSLAVPGGNPLVLTSVAWFFYTLVSTMIAWALWLNTDRKMRTVYLTYAVILVVGLMFFGAVVLGARQMVADQKRADSEMAQFEPRIQEVLDRKAAGDDVDEELVSLQREYGFLVEELRIRDPRWQGVFKLLTKLGNARVAVINMEKMLGFASGGDIMSIPSTEQDIRHRILVLRQVTSSRTRFIKDMDSLRDDLMPALVSAGVSGKSARIVADAIIEFRRIPEIRAHNAAKLDYENAIMTFLKLLADNFGKWSIDPEQGASVTDPKLELQWQEATAEIDRCAIKANRAYEAMQAALPPEDRVPAAATEEGDGSP